ncbi:MarR family winged helix-turn-helix transcriptional regulator [Planotetraspora thailandica]|nr:MarR family transcriptional regulator [Planotetraspora thailandica]
MNGVELFLLGRTLMKIGEEAMPVEGLAPQTTSVRTVLVVVSDLREHPETSVGDIAGRTGLPQSAVSGAVARLREAGSIVTGPDPRDRRRTLIRAAPEVSARLAEVRSSSIAGALASAAHTDDPAEIAELVAMLETLARRLSPRTG